MAINYRNKANLLSGAAIDEIFTADVSLTAKQYYFVSPASTVGNVKAATGASNPAPIGVLQNAPDAAGKARVRVFGLTRLTACAGTCNMIYGKFIRSSSVGAAEVGASGGDNIVAAGRWWAASVATNASALGDCFINLLGFGGVCSVSAS